MLQGFGIFQIKIQFFLFLSQQITHFFRFHAPHTKHVFTQLISSHLPGHREMCHNFPVLHNKQPVRHFQNFIQIRGHQKCRHAVISGFAYQRFPDHLRRSDINAPGRLIRQYKLCTAGKFSCYDYLLNVSSGEHPHRLASVITGNLKFLDQFINCLIDFLCI